MLAVKLEFFKEYLWGKNKLWLCAWIERES